MVARSTAIPKAGAALMLATRLAAAINDFDGTQPTLRHSPPILEFSISATDAPKDAAAAATDRPPAPAPMTQISGFSRSAMGHWRRDASSDVVRVVFDTRPDLNRFTAIGVSDT